MSNQVFKPGDRVRKISGDAFSNGEYVATVFRLDGHRVWLMETSTHTASSELIKDEPLPTEEYIVITEHDDFIEGDHPVITDAITAAREEVESPIGADVVYVYKKVATIKAVASSEVTYE